MESVVRIEGAVELTLEKLVGLGYFKTKNEAIRAGILNLGREYGTVASAQEIEDSLAAEKMTKLEAEAAEGKRKFVPLEKILKKYR